MGESVAPYFPLVIITHPLCLHSRSFSWHLSTKEHSRSVSSPRPLLGVHHAPRSQKRQPSRCKTALASCV